jgi:sulfur carrier protein ThiS
MKKTTAKKRRSGIDTTFGHVNGPETVAELLKQADTREADKHAKKQRQAEKKQEEERKIVKNADHLKVVEQSWRGGNKSLGKPLTKYVRRWMCVIIFSIDHCSWVH